MRVNDAHMTWLWLLGCGVSGAELNEYEDAVFHHMDASEKARRMGMPRDTDHLGPRPDLGLCDVPFDLDPSRIQVLDVGLRPMDREGVTAEDLTMQLVFQVGNAREAHRWQRGNADQMSQAFDIRVGVETWNYELTVIRIPAPPVEPPRTESGYQREHLLGTAYLWDFQQRAVVCAGEVDIIHALGTGVLTPHEEDRADTVSRNLEGRLFKVGPRIQNLEGPS
jgi:hypothetical protein